MDKKPGRGEEYLRYGGKYYTLITAVVVSGTEIGGQAEDSSRFVDNKRIEGTITDMVEEAVAFNLPEPVFENRRNEFVVTLYNKVQEMNYKASDKESKNDLLAFCATPRTRKEIAEFLGIKTIAFVTEHYIRPLLEVGSLKMTIPEKPKSRNQKFYH